nr:hypothetical protein [Tanacetum cinerariifolium]
MRLFQQMLNIKPDNFTVVALLTGYKSLEVFYGLHDKDTASWTSIICALSVNGKTSKALELFTEMKESGLRPDDITFIGVLNACSHRGLVEEGWKHFKSMKSNPKEKDDILVPIYGALLSACRLYGDVDMSEHLADRLMKIEVGDSSIHTLLANIYASVRRWEDVNKVTSKMRVCGVRKEPGCRSIEVNGDIHEFLVGDASHPELKDVYFSLKTDTCKDQRPLSS